MTTIRAHFDGKVLIPTEPVDLPKDRVLEIEVREAAEPQSIIPGSPQAILETMRRLPSIPKEDIAEMKRNIEEGKMPVRYEGIFDEQE